jgi:hypothetical protein
MRSIGDDFFIHGRPFNDAMRAASLVQSRRTADELKSGLTLVVDWDFARLPSWRQ